MFLRIDNDGGSAHGALAASALQQSGAAPSGAPLRLSCRMFVLDRYDALYRLPTQTFERMLQAPQKHPLPRFAASRVRLSDVAVELVGKRPVRVVWSTFDLLVFDDRGWLDADAAAPDAAAAITQFCPRTLTCSKIPRCINSCA